MRDVERLKDKVELSLDSRQIFFLFFGGAVAACLVFVLGVMIGRRLEGRERVGERASTSAAIDPLQALDELGGDEAAAEVPTRPATGAAAPGSAASSGRTASRATPPVPAPIAAPPKTAPAPVTTPTPAPEPAPVVAPKVAASAPVVPPAPRPVAPAPSPVAGDAEARPADGATTSKKPRFTLQLSSFQSKAEADSFAAKVSKGGYKPYITESDVPEKGVFFRVRIGGYASHEEALEAKNSFEQTMGIIAYVTKL